MPKVLNVLYQSDDNYAMVAGASIASLLENNKHIAQINIYYVEYKVTTENKKRLEKLVGDYKNASLQLIDGTGYYNELVKLGVSSWHGGIVTWFRLLSLGDVPLNGSDKVLYLDCHTIVNGGLDELLDIDMGENIMAMVRNCLINSHKKQIGLLPTDEYFDAGVILVNAKKWQQHEISSLVRKELSIKNTWQIGDQDFANVIFKGKIKTLSPTYSFLSAYYAYNPRSLIKLSGLTPSVFYTYDELMEHYYAPKIVHNSFGIKGKPWEAGNDNPVRYLWKKYIDYTPWKNLPKPRAKRTLGWFLYDALPKPVLMFAYRVQVTRKYGS